MRNPSNEMDVEEARGESKYNYTTVIRGFVH